MRRKVTGDGTTEGGSGISKIVEKHFATLHTVLHRNRRRGQEMEGLTPYLQWCLHSTQISLSPFETSLF